MQLTKRTCFGRCVNTRPGKYFKFIVLLILDLVNLCVDWFFFLKIQLAEPGLVYGPANDYIRWSTFTFCCVSIFSFIVESLQNGDDLFCGKRRIKFLNQSVSNFSIVFFEDIPLLVLNLIVTMCRDGEPSMISVIKASVCIGVVFIRLMLMILIHWVFEAKKSKFEFVLDIMSTIGLFVIAIMSVTIQLLNSFPTNPNGLIQIADPAHFNRMDYVTNKYLNGVGIYSQWPLDGSDFNNQSSKVEEARRYIFLANITEIINNTYVSVNIRTNHTLNSENYTLCFTKLGQNTCYLVRGGEASAVLMSAEASNQILASDAFLNKNGYDLAIMRMPAQEYKYKIGYLDYNLNRLAVNVNNSDEQACVNSEANNLFYAKYTPFSLSKNDGYMRSNNEDGEYAFYNYKYDLFTVDKFWRTGIIGCAMTGDLGPKLSRNLRLSC
jgi:hypothetical protein